MIIALVCINKRDNWGEDKKLFKSRDVIHRRSFMSKKTITTTRARERDRERVRRKERERERGWPKHVSNMGGTLRCAKAATKKGKKKHSNLKFAFLQFLAFLCLCGMMLLLLLFVRQSLLIYTEFDKTCD